MRFNMFQFLFLVLFTALSAHPVFAKEVDSFYTTVRKHILQTSPGDAGIESKINEVLEAGVQPKFVMTALLQTGEPVWKKNAKGERVPHYEFIEQGLEGIEYLVREKNFDVNEPLFTNPTLSALHLVFSFDQGPVHPDFVRKLIQLGANVNLEDGLGTLPTNYAFGSSDLEATQVLVENGARIDWDSVYLHVETLEGLEFLGGLDGYDLKEGIKLRTQSGRSPLFAARDPKLVEVLLDAGANPTLLDDQKIPPFARQVSNPEILKVYLDAGLSPKFIFQSKAFYSGGSEAPLPQDEWVSLLRITLQLSANALEGFGDSLKTHQNRSERINLLTNLYWKNPLQSARLLAKNTEVLSVSTEEEKEAARFVIWEVTRFLETSKKIRASIEESNDPELMEMLNLSSFREELSRAENFVKSIQRDLKKSL